MPLLTTIRDGIGYFAHSAYRILQFILAITVCGLYGVDLNRADREKKYSDSKWVYAEVIASLSAITSLLYLIPFVSRFHLLYILDTIYFLMWIALFAVFGNLYIPANAQGDSGIERMKHAVWVDLVNALLWFGSAVWLFCLWKDWGRKAGGGFGRRGAREGGRRSGWTGRARTDGTGMTGANIGTVEP